MGLNAHEKGTYSFEIQTVLNDVNVIWLEVNEDPDVAPRILASGVDIFQLDYDHTETSTNLKFVRVVIEKPGCFYYFPDFEFIPCTRVDCAAQGKLTDPDTGQCIDTDPLDEDDIPDIPGGGIEIPGRGESDTSAVCLFSRLLAVFFGITSILLVFLAVCLSNPYLGIAAAVMLALSIALFWLWNNFCAGSECEPFLLFGWQIHLGGSLLTLAYAGCCAYGFVVSAVMGAIAIGLFILWRNKCKPSLCKIALELSFVFVTVLTEVFSILTIVSIACANPITISIISGVGGLITTGALLCARQNIS